MIFLLEYDRPRGELVQLIRFGDNQQEEARNRRIELEVQLNAEEVRHEVVILEAASEGDLRLTHRRYFLGLEQLSISPVTAS